MQKVGEQEKWPAEAGHSLGDGLGPGGSPTANRYSDTP